MFAAQESDACGAYHGREVTGVAVLLSLSGGGETKTTSCVVNNKRDNILPICDASSPLYIQGVDSMSVLPWWKSAVEE